MRISNLFIPGVSAMILVMVSVVILWFFSLDAAKATIHSKMKNKYKKR
jgi:hypothetical protein